MKFNKFLKNMSFVTIFICELILSSAVSHAIGVEPYKIKGIDNVFWDEDVPAALRVTTAGDNLPVGTILYRNSYKDLDYYSPIPPYSLQGTVSDINKGKYNKWGPWWMSANQESRGIVATVYYPSGTLNKVSKVYTDNGTGSSSATQYVGDLPANKSIEILAYSDGQVYFDLTKHPSLSQVGATKIARTSSSNVNVNPSQKVSLLYPGYSNYVKYNDKNAYFLQNFKPLGKYNNTMKSWHKGMEKGHYKNPSYAPSVVAGLYGEWRYLGYNAQGEALDNPYFVSDIPSFQSISGFYGYPFRYTPWDPYDTREAGESNQLEAYNRFAIGGKTFKYDKDPKYRSLKVTVMNRMVNEGHIPNAYDYIDRLSLRTYPEKQPTILLGQRKDAKSYRVGFLPLIGGLRDLYVKQINVIDTDNNSTVATWTCNINGGCPATTGEVYKGRLYKIQIILANGANSKLLKNTLEAQVGYMYNEPEPYPDLPFSRTSNSKILRQGNKGAMYHSVNSTSNPFEDTLYVSTDGTIDVYGYVGGSHTGVDNLRYDNDLGVIRLKVKTVPPPPSNNCEIINSGKTKICGKGDLAPHGIKVFSKTEGGKLVYYQEYGKKEPSIREALIPGYEYRVVYNIIYQGDDILEYTWIPPIQDNPATENINEYVPGRWSNPSVKICKIPISHYIEKYSGGTRDLDSTSKNDYGFEVHPNPEDRYDTDIDMYNNVMIGYYADIMMYEHPYLKATINIPVTDSRINSNRNNDSMTIILKDNFDIAISNLRVTPSTSYVGNNQKVNYNVTYDATLTTPSYVKLEDYETTINTAININGKTYYVKDHLLKGNTYNKNITHSIEDVAVPSTGSVTASVNLNYDKKSYETSDFSNNMASTTVAVKKIKNPSSGSPSDTVKPNDTLNSNNPNKGGDANNNCLVPRTKNTWTSTHGKITWSSKDITYNKISNGAPVTFKKYSTSYKNVNEATETYQEQFGITKILFRSKYTKDKKYGNDGWVDLLNSSQKDLGIIQAGYGFELQVETAYSTDAFTKRTWNVSNNGSSGTRVSGLNTEPNYGLEDIFVELPGTTGTNGTRKILSSTGYEETTLGLNATKKVRGNTVTWTYTVKPSKSVGIKETPKIFIPDTTKDGDYTLKIYTPPVAGVGNINKKTYSALCDRKEVTIKVKGSAMNDLNSHNTQVH